MMQPLPQRQQVREQNTKEDTNGFGFDGEVKELQKLCNLELIDVLEQEPAFAAVDDGVYISNNEIEYKFRLIKEILNGSIRPAIAKKIVDILGAEKGKFLTDLLGFKPSTNHGGSGVITIKLLFGKLYIPTIEDFSVTVSITKSEKKKGDIKIKLFGFGGGGSKEFSYKVDQTKKIQSTPMDIVIPTQFEQTKWEHENGEFFYTLKVVRPNDYISVEEAENPYDGIDGYDEILSMRGNVREFSTEILAEPEKTSEEFEDNTVIKLSAKILPAYIKAPIDITGTATVRKIFKILYSIPTGYKYAVYTENKDNFQHLWASQGGSVIVKP